MYDEFSFSEKEDYIRDNCSYTYSPGNMEKIQNDDSLTDSQKEEMQRHLRIYGM